MNWIKAVLLTGILSNLFLSAAPAAFAADRRARRRLPPWRPAAY